jgi:hypothetical protein
MSTAIACMTFLGTSSSSLSLGTSTLNFPRSHQLKTTDDYRRLLLRWFEQGPDVVAENAVASKNLNQSAQTAGASPDGADGAGDKGSKDDKRNVDGKTASQSSVPGRSRSTSKNIILGDVGSGIVKLKMNEIVNMVMIQNVETMFQLDFTRSTHHDGFLQCANRSRE